MTANGPALSLVLPTYNERENLPVVIGQVIQSLEKAEVTFEIIVVDDDSPDMTWQIAHQIASNDRRVRVIRRCGQRGLATAVAAGWQQARGQILGVMDADLQYRPESLPELLRVLDDDRIDIAIASRYVRGATVQEWSLKRWTISLGARLLARLALPDAVTGIRDPGAGYFLFRRRVIAGIGLRPQGFKILMEVLARGRYGRVVEVRHQYMGRKEGKSKLRGRQVAEYLGQLARLSYETGELWRGLWRGTSGLATVSVNLMVLWALTEHARLHYLWAGVAAVEAAILASMASALPATVGRAGWRPAGPRLSLRRVLAWHRARGLGGLMNVVVLAAAVEGAGLHYVAAGLIAIAANTVTNCVIGRTRMANRALEVEAATRVAPWPLNPREEGRIQPASGSAALPDLSRAETSADRLSHGGVR